MKKLSKLFGVSRTEVLITLVIGIAITVVIIASPKWSARSGAVNASASSAQPQMVNHSQSLIITQSSLGEERVALKLKNTSKKTVTAFHITTGTTRMLIDFAYSDRDIKSDQEFTQIVPVLPGSAISLDAVVFENGANEGRADAIQIIQDRRSAHKALKGQASLRIGELLTSSLNAASLDQAISEIASLQIPPTSKEFEIGLATAKQDVQHDLSEIKSKLDDAKFKAKDELARIKGVYDKGKTK